jgi:hypothetical protein
MQTVFVVGVVWIALSFTLGPLLAWAFFYSERRAKAAEVALDHRIAMDPTATLPPGFLKDASPFGDGSFSDRRGSFTNYQSSNSPVDATP